MPIAKDEGEDRVGVCVCVSGGGGGGGGVGDDFYSGSSALLAQSYLFKLLRSTMVVAVVF